MRCQWRICVCLLYPHPLSPIRILLTSSSSPLPHSSFSSLRIHQPLSLSVIATLIAPSNPNLIGPLLNSIDQMEVWSLEPETHLWDPPFFCVCVCVCVCVCAPSVRPSVLTFVPFQAPPPLTVYSRRVVRPGPFRFPPVIDRFGL